MHVLGLALEQLVLDGSNQARACKVELDGEIGGVHLDSFAIRFVVDVFLPAAKRGRLAGCSEEVEILRSRGGEIYESTKRTFMMDDRGGREIVHTLDSFCHSRGRVLLQGAILHRCREGGGRKREPF